MFFNFVGSRMKQVVFHHTSAFCGKFSCKSIKFLREENLDKPIRQIFRLDKLISTILAMTALAKEAFSFEKNS